MDDIEAPITRNAGSIDAVQFNLTLGKSLTLAKTAVNFNIGIPALGLAVDGGVSVTLDFVVKLRFGVSRTAGFYLDTSQPDEIKVDLKASTPNLQAHGRLGFMQLDASDDATNPSNVQVKFAIDIKKPTVTTGPDKDRLTFDDILRTQDIEQIFAASLSGGATV